MGEVVDFKTRECVTDAGFMACGCAPESIFMPVGETINGNVTITGLQCIACDAFADVIDGVVQHDGWVGQ